MNVNSLTLEKKKLLAAELAPLILGEFRATSEMIIPGAEKAVKVKTRAIDTGLISADTRTAFANAETEISNASNFEELKAASQDMAGIVRTILMGHNE
ncbi:hypothetical protein [Maridesulfovibrio sp.]|uniref:hypothetical protein n=1 Tax=Maridesulfovibrio sp. TaxID=2795000 RepID=UPI0029CA0E02|nr:hypothetical protein [Maridesulfovibrio sp.]